MTEIPFAYVVLNNNQYIVQECPFCGASGKEAHTHDAKPDERDDEYRSKCSGQESSLYYLTTDITLNGESRTTVKENMREFKLQAASMI